MAEQAITAKAVPIELESAATPMPASIQGLSRLPLLRQLGLLIGLAASVAIGVAVVLWSQTPNYRLLYGNLAERDLTQIASALDQANIPYKIDYNTGAMMVDEQHANAARLNLASHGLPQSAKEGFELMDQDSGFGTSQFMEAARYNRAIEGELARTITSIRNVEKARVHLALPRQSLFVRKQQTPSASVFVKLYPGRRLSEGQVAAIVHMVASGIPNLEIDRVTVVDHKGRLLTGKDSSEMALSATHFEHTQRLQEQYLKHIESILAPILGAEKFKAQVAVDMDYTMTEQTQENYQADPQAIRSEQIVEEKTLATGVKAGIPGALSNQPPVAATTATEQGDQALRAANENATAGSYPENTSRHATRNYELGRTISHTRKVPGQIKRLSVAVVVDNKMRLDKAGKTISEALSQQDVDRISVLVKEAVGFNADRGDTVRVVNIPFYVTTVEEIVPLEEAIWEQPWVWDIGKQVLGGLAVILLVFTVLRPAMRNLSNNSKLAVAQIAPAAAGAMGGEGSASAFLDAPVDNSYDAELNAAKSMVSEDPKRVAQVVKNWVGNDG
ncbi:MAG: flagellar basal-body MS-ring/collar protein FliF [Gammaproteobacteria bacterium]|nr:MAG: flagellar basal-body MS-ring/collar protein FliF [Gammaproteobacteria bacterium]